MKEIIGKVTEEEKMAIWRLNQHKRGLEELLPVLSKDDPLFNEASNDYKETMEKYNNWWTAIYQKYHLRKGEANWQILFDTNELFIEK